VRPFRLDLHELLWGLTLVVVGLAVTVAWRLAAYLRFRRALEANWGQPVSRDARATKYDLRRRLAGESEGPWVDDQTWRDLDMDDVMAALDRTITGFGAQRLRVALGRWPATGTRPWDERVRAAQDLLADPARRVACQRALLLLDGEKVGWAAPRAIWRRLDGPPLAPWMSSCVRRWS
jgi:hypothetical protein